jgi:hypothetical protein
MMSETEHYNDRSDKYENNNSKNSKHFQNGSHVYKLQSNTEILLFND